MSQSMIRFNCPQCHELYSTPASLAGKVLTCKCGMKVPIPSVSQVVGSVAKQPGIGPQPQPFSSPKPASTVPSGYVSQSTPQPQYQYPPTQGSQAGAMNMPTKFCHACGQSIDARAEICPKCGVRQAGIPSSGSLVGKNRLIAALLALLLPGLGAHHFYLGRPILGIIYLLFCWTFIPILISVIEGLVLLCTSDESFHQRYPG